MTDEPEVIAAVVKDQAQRLADKMQARPVDAPPRRSVVPDLDQHLTRIKRAASADRWAQLVPGKYQAASKDEFGPAVRAGIERWGEAWHDGVNLVLIGPVGTGKTRAAFAAARLAHEHGAHFTRWPEHRLKEGLDYHDLERRARVKAEVTTADVLLLDDLGAHKPNDWWVGELFSIMEERWEADLASVVTTNLEPAEFLAAVGERTYSRVVGGSAITVRLTGNDRRLT